MCSNEKCSDAKTSGHKRVDSPEVPDDWQDGERHGFSIRIEAANRQLHPISHDNVLGGGHFNMWGEKGRERPRKCASKSPPRSVVENSMKGEGKN